MNFDIKEMINSIIEFIEIVIANVQAALNGIVKVPGYEKEENYPDNFPKAE